MMRMLSRRALSLKTLSILVILSAWTTLFLLFILPKYQYEYGGDVAGRIKQHAPTTGSTSNDALPVLRLPHHSAMICLPREALNTEPIRVHSGRTQSNKYFFTIGISTLVRKIGSRYLMSTVKSLLKESKDSNLRILIVIFLADTDTLVRDKLREEIYSLFKTHIESGTIDVIQAPSSFYPRPEKLKRRFGDSEKRVQWRSKQVIDYSFLLCYCHSLSQYHIQLEDDVVASPNYLLKAKDFMEYHDKRNISWHTLDSSVLGYIGKIYHNSELQQLATFFYLMFDEMPVDWLEYSWRDFKGQSPRYRFRPASLFQHVGYESSLVNKKQLRQERYFDKYSQKFLGLNPPATVYTDIEYRKGTRLENAYKKGGDFFWGICLKQESCSINLIFHNVITVKKLFIGSGSNFAAEDKFENSTVLAGTAPGKEDCLHYDYENPMHFSTTGELDKAFPEGLKVSCFKIVVKNQKHWFFLREIDVWTI